MKNFLNLLSAIFAIFAGVLWLASAVAKSNAPPTDQQSFAAPMGTEKKPWELVATLALQSKLSAAAAIAASIAAFCQAGALLVPEQGQ